MHVVGVGMHKQSSGFVADEMAVLRRCSGVADGWIISGVANGVTGATAELDVTV